MRLRDRVFRFLQRRLTPYELPLRIVFQDGAAFDFAPAPRLTLRMASPRAERRLLRGDVDGLAECYVDGDLVVDGEIGDVVEIGIATADRLAAMPRFARLARLAAPLVALARRTHSRRSDAAAIRFHYDVSNEFYGLWLDRNMVYSCAYFRTGEESIDLAQEQKLDHICRKLRLAPGERLLDIGCGWGGLLLWAARHYGIDGVGVTLSERQLELARRRVAEAGLASRIEIRLQDYRDVPGAAVFDKIASVGMVEHVGLRNLPIYFAAIARLLKPGGLVLNHGITIPDRDSRRGGPAGGGFLDRHVFPDGELAHVSRILYEAAGAGLEIHDVESLRPHYAATLARWVANLEGRRDEAIALAGAPRYRVWRVFMAGTGHAFARGWLDHHQLLAAKPLATGPAPRPWTREYQYPARE